MQITEFLVDHIIEILGVLIAVAALIVQVLQRRKKSFSFSVESSTPIVIVSSSYESEKIKILFDGKEVSQVYLYDLQFRNTGNLPIHPNDYIEPITLSFNKPAFILSHEIIDKYKLGVSLKKDTAQNKITLSKILLNPRDLFKMRLYIANSKAKPILNGRIVGVKNISLDLSPAIEKYFKSFASFWLIYGAFLFLFLVISIFLPSQYLNYFNYLFAFWLALGLLHGVIVRYYEAQKQKRNLR